MEKTRSQTGGPAPESDTTLYPERKSKDAIIRRPSPRHDIAFILPQRPRIRSNSLPSSSPITPDTPFTPVTPTTPATPTTPTTPATPITPITPITPATPGKLPTPAKIPIPATSSKSSSQPLPQSPVEVLRQYLQTTASVPPISDIDFCEGSYEWPKTTWGEEEPVGLSKIQRAEKEVKIWEGVWECHFGEDDDDAGRRDRDEKGKGKEGDGDEDQNQNEELRAFIKENLEDAKRKRDALERTEENLRVGDIDPSKPAIATRLEALNWALSISKFEPERENIRAAIAGYESGAIGYTKHLTVIYAGKIVDTAPDYASLVRTRQERLDRYAEAHGPHWIFYESPLDVHPETQPLMMKSLSLDRKDSWTNLGPYYLNQGYWKRAGWVRRMPQMANSSISVLEPTFRRLPDGRVACQEPGPKQCFRSLLDSGATYPSLYREDLQKLAIDETNYACQAVATMKTANGIVNARIFELFVCVLDDNNEQLVDPNDAAWPYHAHYLGGLCPCIELLDTLDVSPEGVQVGDRLSGLLPFVACYMTSTPTRNTLFLGEDRKDVLGSHRIPGHKKWDIQMPNGPPGSAVTWDMFGDPKTTFVHRQGRIIDRDDPNLNHASTVTFLPGTEQEYTITINPIEELEKDRAERAARDAHLNNPAWAPGRAHLMDPPL